MVTRKLEVVKPAKVQDDELVEIDSIEVERGIKYFLLEHVEEKNQDALARLIVDALDNNGTLIEAFDLMYNLK